MEKKLNKKWKTILTIILLFFILFTSPLIVYKDINRLGSPPINSQAVKSLDLPKTDKPYVYEAWVDEKIEYQYDFETYGVFWYIPTVDEVIEKGRGDCKSRAILLASILEAENINYTLHISPYHWWVSYPYNPETKYENPKTSLKTDENWKLPNILITIQDMWDVKDEYYQMIWVAMPLWKKLFLSIGLLSIWLPSLIRDKKISIPLKK